MFKSGYWHFFVSDFLFLSFGFVSYFVFRISDFARSSPDTCRVLVGPAGGAQQGD
jgi:hypothetical protein